MGTTWSQSFPPRPILTEENLPSQRGKVFIVTGGASGVGFELCRMLFQAGGTVYLAGRSETKALSAISRIEALSNKEPGELFFLRLSLDDLTTIKPAVEVFTAAESQLDVLVNNAGVMCPPKGSWSAQHHEIQMATNCLGHYLLTQLLLPTLKITARASPPGSTRVVWSSSIVVDTSAPRGGGINAESLAGLPKKSPQAAYAISKTGNWFLAKALADQAGSDGVVSLTMNPGNLNTSLTRHVPKLAVWLTSPILHEAKMGAYTELWTALSPELGLEDNGSYVLPWGRKHPSPRPDLLAALKSKEEGGTGDAAFFAQWCELQTREFR